MSESEASGPKPQETEPGDSNPSKEPANKSVLIAWLELCRISNLPTVWSNVLVGYALGWLCTTEYIHSGIPGRRSVPEIPNAEGWQLIGQVALAMSLLYIGGMALNDVVDARVDKLERPNRPIPSGRISFGAAATFVALCFAGGLALMMPLGLTQLAFAVGLVLTISAYDLIHKKAPASVFLMGACRGWVYLIAAASWYNEPMYWGSKAWLLVGLFVVVITAYTVCITLVARAEVQKSLDARKWIAVAMPIAVLAMMFAVPSINDVPPWRPNALIAGIALLYWMGLAVRHVMAKPPRTIKAILTWLSGMCLVDAYFLCVLGQPPMITLLAALCFALTHVGHRKIMGT